MIGPFWRLDWTEAAESILNPGCLFFMYTRCHSQQTSLHGSSGYDASHQKCRNKNFQSKSDNSIERPNPERNGETVTDLESNGGIAAGGFGANSPDAKIKRPASPPVF